MKYFFMAIAIVTGCIACSKGNTEIFNPFPPVDNETPLAAVLRSDSPSYNLAVHDPQAKELGYLFVPLKKGKIYGMGIRMPQVGQSFIVTLWDTLTKKAIKQKTVTNTIGSGFNYIDLSSASIQEEIDVEANHAYIISVNTAAITAGTPNRSWYLLSKKGSANFLPLAKGHIRILEGRYSNADASTPSYPDKSNLDVFGLHLLFGMVDIGYYATEY